ncbi:hypothetical protein HY229_04480 [Candidatus Acetothermia bacterium]|nr:hypothetical protein [Candidatus Acetothermia bacterium]MBI3643342.1 hypothetical protein [Candidatus Acetothermia bacterium]
MSDKKHEHRPEISDSDMEKLLSCHLASKADTHLAKLDQRLAKVLDERRDESRASQGVPKVPWFQNPRIIRLALSHALIAAIFFGVGSFAHLWGGSSSTFSSSTPAPISQFDARISPKLPDQTLEFGAAVKMAGPEKRDPEDMLSSALGDQTAGLTTASQSLNPGAENDNTATGTTSSGAAAKTMISAPPPHIADEKPASLAREYSAQIRDGYLFVLTPSSVVRLRLDQTDKLIQNLQSPADWQFDMDGNLWIVDQTSEGAVLYKLNRIEPQSDSLKAK